MNEVASNMSNLLFPDKTVQEDNILFTRRHSLSLLDRTPPPGSLAADILLTPRPDLSRTHLLVKELKEHLSDFGSCISESSESDDLKNESDAESLGSQSMNERKRLRKSKRKIKVTPGKDYFLKKPNLVLSPTQL